MGNQFNIRSEFAREAAARIAKRLGQSTTAVVEAALERYDRETSRIPDFDDLTPEQKERVERWRDAAKASRSEGDPDATSNHDWLYDERGLPK